MVASGQIETLFYTGIGRQRGPRFDALAQNIERTVLPFFRKYNVQAAERVGADLFEVAAPNISEIVSGRTNFKTAAKSEARQTFGKLSRSGSKKRLQAASSQQNLKKIKSVAKRHFYKQFSLTMSSNFGY